MWSWLTQNKEWLFSGAGLTVLAVIVWFVRNILKREPSVPPANSVTQSPSITVSPVFNLPEMRSPEPPKPAARPIASTNLKDEAIKLGKIALQGDIWTNSPGIYSPEPLWRALFADISNVPLDAGNITTINVKAAIKIEYDGRARTYSPLPWLEEFTNTVRIAPAERKVVVLAVGQDTSTGPWYFVLNRRESHNAPSNPSAMDWTNMVPIPSYLPFEIQLVDVQNGALVGRFKYLWTFDSTLNYPILKTVS
jgi:hypothetical protein